MMRDHHVPAHRRIWLIIVAGLVLGFLVLPVLIVIPISFSASSLLEFPPQSYSLRWYQAFFGSVEWRDAAWMSIRVAVLTTLSATPLGVAAAYGLHLTESRFTNALRLMVLAPLLVPTILTAVGIFYVYALLGLNNTLLGIVSAHTMLALPFVVVSVGAGLRSYDMAQERVARSLGAPWLRAFWSITLPQIKFPVASGALLAFITSFDEVIVSFFISGGEMSTLPRRMFNALRDQIEPTIAAISTMLVVLSVVTVLALEFFRVRRPTDG
jgi:putative spermidine/putrescine transport system permease protein